MVHKISKWHRLDNSAKIYPMLANKKNQNLFCLNFVLKQDVSRDRLQEALELTLERFPSFKVKLMKGIFWYYFDYNGAKPTVYPLDGGILKKIDHTSCDGYCFRISYYRRLISGDFFHAICDGTGAAEFMKSLIYTYLNLCGHPVRGDNKVLTVGSPVQPGELEDSFLKNYRKVKLRDLRIDSLKGAKAYHINGILFEDGGNGVIHADCDGKQLLETARAHGATITELLCSLFILSIYDAQIQDNARPTDDIQIFCPINLRKIFPSITLRNFSLFSRIGANTQTDMDLDKLIAVVHESIKRDVDPEFLLQKISTTVRGEKFWPMRLMPLVVKQLIFKISNRFFGKNKKTATFSNVGVLSLPDDFRPYVEKAAFCISVNAKTPITMTVCTVFGNCNMTFTRCVTGTEVEKCFCRRLRALGLDVKVSSNFWEVEHAL